MPNRTSQGKLSEDTAPAGTQSIGRAIAVLKQVARADRNGLRLTDVASTLGLKVPTASRLLKALIAEHLVIFDESQRTYHVGTELLALSAISNSTATWTRRLLPVLTGLTEALGDTTYLMLRRGDDALCTAVQEGRNPIRVMTLKVGDVRPLGVGAACLAMLAFLPAAERDQLLARSADRFSGYGFETDKVKKAATEARKQGFAVNPGLLIPGVHGVGFPIFHEDRLIAGIGVMAVKERLGPRQRADVSEAFSTILTRARDVTAIPPYPLD